jgi:kynurenine formamidase
MHPLNAKTLYWPTSPTGFKLDSLSYGPTPGGWFYSSFAFSAPEHGGTHLDAPIHFGEGHLTVDRVPLDRLIAPAVVIDVTAKTKADGLSPNERYYGVPRRAREDRAWDDRAAANGLELAVARQEDPSGRRHAQ